MSRLTEMIAERSIEDGDCLRWTGWCFNGHPGISVDGKKQLARRALWIEQRGEIPAGKILRCTCETALCVNLDHCKLTTYRAVARELGAVGVMSGPVRSAKIAAVKRVGSQARITQDEARAIRQSEDSSTALAQRYGVSVSTVCRIKRGQVRREFGANVWQGLGA